MHTINDFFFLTDPEQLIQTHLPDDPAWQLLQTPVSFDQFENNVYIRERFFQLGLQITSDHQQSSVLSTTRGAVSVSFSVPEAKSGDYNFRYLVYKSKSQQTNDATLERYVFFQKRADRVTWDATFPVAGMFKLDIFGQDRSEHEALDLVCSYLIDCRDPETKVDPLPDCPDIGWGPTSETGQV